MARRARSPGRSTRPARCCPRTRSDSLSLDEALELLTTTGWALTPALLAAIPEALALRRAPHPQVATLRRRTAGFLAPWDGPAAIVFADGRRVGALVDRNGLRPAAFAVTRDRLVAVASEAGAVPFSASETVRRGRLGPGELLLVEPGRRAIMEDTEAKTWVLRDLPIHDAARPTYEDRVDVATVVPDPPPTTSCATSPDSTPSVPGSTSRRWRSKATSRCGAWATTRRRQAAAASTGRWPIISARRSPRSRTRPSTPNANGSSWTSGSSSAGGRRSSAAHRAGPGPSGLARPIVVDLDGLLDAVRAGGGRSSVRTLDATWDPETGPDGLAGALDRLATEAVAASRRGAQLLVLTDAAWSLERLPIPSILATGAVHTALTAAGLRGRTDLAVSAVDILDVHAMAMTLAVGATAVQPRLAIELAAELAGTRGAETLSPAEAVAGLASAFEAGLRKTLARMGISAVASYIGGSLIDVVDLDRSVVARCFPNAAAWPGRTTLADLGARQIRRRAAALAIPEPPPVASHACPTPASRASGPTAKRTCSRRASPARSRSSRRPTPTARRSTSMPRWPATGPPWRGRRATGPCPATSCASGAPASPCRSRRSRTPGRSSAGSSCRR